MKLLLVKIAALAVLVAATLVLIFLLPMPYSDDLAAIVNKRDLLRNSREAPVIFVGEAGCSTDWTAGSSRSACAGRS